MNLKVENIHYAYGFHRVLKGVCLEASYGEMIHILGANGAGKSTLFSCLLGHKIPKKGKILVNERLVEKLSVRELSKEMAYIPQFTRSAYNYSVLDMVLMGRTAHTSLFCAPSKSDHFMAKNMLFKMGIEHLEKRGFLEISGGERRLALIARALVQEAKILIMDEPCANLDYGNAIRVQKQMKTLAEEGYLILQSSHDPQHALLFADKVIVLMNGQTQICGSPSKVLTPKTLKDLYNVSVSVVDGLLKPVV